MPKTCQAENCSYNVFSNGFCQRHGHLRTDQKYLLKKNKPSILKKPKQATSKVYRIPKVSKKMSKSLKIYHGKRLIYLMEHPNCEFPGCNQQASDIHHKKSRGLYLNDVSTWMSVCRHHHTWIHDNDKEAREKGLLLSKLEK